jgi:hypothetical protein
MIVVTHVGAIVFAMYLLQVEFALNLHIDCITLGPVSIVMFVISFILIALSLASLHCRSNLHSKRLCSSRMFTELTHLIMQLMY